jgi:hypothetical protein
MHKLLHPLGDVNVSEVQTAIARGIRTEDFEETRRSALETLVRARGPIPQQTLARMETTVNAGQSYSYIAARMNELELVDGMGKGWTEKRVQAALDEYERRTGQHEAPSRRSVSHLQREARDGLMRAWLEILRERHPGTNWIVDDSPQEDDAPTHAQDETAALASAA